MPKPNPIIARETLLQSSRFRVERVTQQLASEQTHSRDIIKHPGAVVILPLMDDGRICMIRNYRVAIERELLELPAGTLDRAEPPIETARRELLEETGFHCGSIRPLLEFQMSPGILDERMHAFVAHDLTHAEQALEVGEQIEIAPVNLVELDRLLREGRIQDSKSLATLLYYLRYST